jgi:hypothetical protein
MAMTNPILRAEAIKIESFFQMVKFGCAHFGRSEASPTSGVRFSSVLMAFAARNVCKKSGSELAKLSACEICFGWKVNV